LPETTEQRSRTICQIHELKRYSLLWGLVAGLPLC
jgi:hypothetical protein